MSTKLYHKKKCFEWDKKIVHALQCDCTDNKGKSLNYWKSETGKRILIEGKKYKNEGSK